MSAKRSEHEHLLSFVLEEREVVVVVVVRSAC